MITRILKTIWQVERPGIGTHMERCLHSHHRRSTCTRCVDACPTGALAFDEGLKLDLGRCRECGTCTSVCPTSALEACAPTDDQLLVEIHRAVLDQRPVVFACIPMTPGSLASHVISVPCLGRLDESLLLSALALGAPAVYLLDAECTQCPFANARAVVDDVLTRVRGMLSGSSLAFAITSVEELPEGVLAALETRPKTTTGSSRRDFLRLMVRQGARMGSEAIHQQLGGAAETVPCVERTGMPVLPPKRDLFLKSWRRINQDSAISIDSTGLWAHLAVGDACTMCQMCARFCPTGALQATQREGVQGLAFAAARCIDCGLCAEVCFKAAIQYSHLSETTDLQNETAVLLREHEMEAMTEKMTGDSRLKESIRLTLGL